MSTRRFRETTISEQAIHVDRAGGVIRGVKLLGTVSKNTLRAMNVDRKVFGSVMDKPYRYEGDRSAAYEGMPFNLNHFYGDGDRPVQDCIGEVRNCIYKPDGHYGDVHIIKSHPLAEFVLDAAEKFPNRFGCSHEAIGEPEVVNGEPVVRDWEPSSVDLVSRPATTNGMYESQKKEPTKMAKTIKQAIKESKNKKLARYLREMETSDMIDPSAEVMEMDPAAVDAGGGEPDLRGALLSMLMARLESANSGELQQVLDLLGVSDSIADNLSDSPAATESEDEENKATESEDEENKATESEDEETKATESLQRENAELRAKASLLESGRKATPERIEALCAVKASTQRKLVESWPRDAGGSDEKPKFRGNGSYRATSTPSDPVSKLDAKFQEILARR